MKGHAQVEPRSTFTLARDRPYIASILKLRDIGNQPLNLRAYARN